MGFFMALSPVLCGNFSCYGELIVAGMRVEPPPFYSCAYVLARKALIPQALKIASSKVDVIPPGGGSDGDVKESLVASAGATCTKGTARSTFLRNFLPRRPKFSEGIGKTNIYENKNSPKKADFYQ
jgi:hypothetical protein